MAKNGLSFNFDFDGKETLNAIQDIIEKLKNPEMAFRSIANFMRSRVIEHFRQNQGSTAQWKPLSPVTIALRKKGPKKSNSTQILRDTGDLLNSIQGGPGSIFEVKSNYAKVGTTISYAVYHEQPDNKGGTNSFGGKRIIPKRDFMFLSSDDIDSLKEILEITFFGKGKKL